MSVIALIHSGLRFRRLALATLLGVWLSALAHAGYTVALLSDGLAARTARVGEEFNLDVQLTSDALDQHWATDLRVEFSSSGLQLIGYEWSSPFITGGLDDASVPAVAAVPSIIRAGLVPDGPGVSNRVDLFLSNFTTNTVGYRDGRVVRLRLAVPADYVGVDKIRAQIVAAMFGDGFSVIPTRVAEPFSLQIEPATGQTQPSLSVSAAGGLASLSWPAIIQGATLQTTADLAGEWVDVLETPQVIEGRNRVNLSLGVGAAPRFFRLRFP